MAQDMTPAKVLARFELTSFLQGHTKAWGIFEDRFGRLRRRFDVEMHGTWKDGVFVLDESFVYDDGRREQRTWLVTPLSNGRFEATCADCVGKATGVCAQDTISMSYGFRLRLPSRVIKVDIHDRLYRMSARTVVNRATVRKWGVRLGEMSLFFERQLAEPTPG
jgi:Protein of unknown function (DUF3833)